MTRPPFNSADSVRWGVMVNAVQEVEILNQARADTRGMAQTFNHLISKVPSEPCISVSTGSAFYSTLTLFECAYSCNRIYFPVSYSDGDP